MFHGRNAKSNRHNIILTPCLDFIYVYKLYKNLCPSNFLDDAVSALVVFVPFTGGIFKGLHFRRSVLWAVYPRLCYLYCLYICKNSTPRQILVSPNTGSY